MGYAIYDQAKNTPVNLFTPRWRLRLDMIETQSLLAVGCNALGGKVNASNIQPDSVEYGVYSGLLSGAGKIVEYYYRTILYINLTTKKQVRKTCSDGIKFVTVNELNA